MELVVRNGRVIAPGGVFVADVGLAGERIVALGQELHAAVEIDAAGCYVLPGGVDPHVHLQMPSGPYVSADDFASGTRAAACGGTTSVIDFVEPGAGETFLAALERRRTEADGHAAVDYSLHMTIPAWHAAHPESLAGLPQVVAAGVSSFKLYTAYAGLYLNDVQLYTALEAVAGVDGLPIVHAENGPLCDHLRAQAVAAGQIEPRYHALTRPPRQEAEAVSRIIDLAALAESRLYVVHVSCAEAVARLASARMQGAAVLGETCPQYLTLTADALAGPHGERFICAPPLRSHADQNALWAALAGGVLDTLATDHCPFTAAEKAENNTFTQIPGGLPSIEARLSLAYTRGVRAGYLSLERWVEVCCTAPARLFGLRRKGRIAPGYDADLVIFDPQKEVILNKNVLHERVDWTPYEGIKLWGWPRHVFSRGQTIVRDGEFVGRPGHGQFICRQPGEHT
ncbi:MAG: dihydropyrimidinase [Chloroflexota bacterium]